MRVIPSGPPAGLRERILRRDRYRCVYCGEPFPPEELTLDHVQPRMRGGDRSAGNLVSCCRRCNAAKAGMPAWAYLARHVEARRNFFDAVAGSDVAHAVPVWDRHLRAIREAAGEKATLQRSGPSED